MSSNPGRSQSPHGQDGRRRPSPLGRLRRRRFYPLERRVFCACELCRIRYWRMLYNRVRSGEPLRSYRPGGTR